MKIEENMKKTLSLVLFLAFVSYQSQYLIIGKDSISVDKFKTENKYGLENSGIENTVKTYVDFKLLQNFALEAIKTRFNTTECRISAQDYLIKFYSDFGFQDTGKKYLEDDIPHTEMARM